MCLRRSRPHAEPTRLRGMKWWRSWTAQLLIRHNRRTGQTFDAFQAGYRNGTHRLGESLDHNLRLEGEFETKQKRIDAENPSPSSTGMPPSLARRLER